MRMPIHPSSRFIVFDHNGSVFSVSQKEHEQIYPHPGWVEYDPSTILENVRVDKCLFYDV